MFDELDLKLYKMKKLIAEDENNPEIINLSRLITMNDHTPQGKARAIYNFIKENMYFVRDPGGIDDTKRALVSLNVGRADCDESSVLYAVLARTANLPVKLRAVSFDGNIWGHIYPLVLTNGRWSVYDASAPVMMEQEVTGYLKKRDYDV